MAAAQVPRSGARNGISGHRSETRSAHARCVELPARRPSTLPRTPRNVEAARNLGCRGIEWCTYRQRTAISASGLIGSATATRSTVSPGCREYVTTPAHRKQCDTSRVCVMKAELGWSLEPQARGCSAERGLGAKSAISGVSRGAPWQRCEVGTI
jgi:hypothetical protein